MATRWLILAGLVLVGGETFFYLSQRPLPVSAVRVVRGSAIDAVYASGTVEAVDRVEIKARVAGPIGEMLVREGQEVRKGQLLARIDAPTLGFDVARGRADLRAAQERVRWAPQVAVLEHQTAALRAQFDQARADETRLIRLVRSGASTPQDLERVRTALASLEAQMAATRSQQQDVRIALRAEAGRQRAGVAALKARAREVQVYAPMDGVVLSRRVEPGQVVAVNENLLRIADLRHLWIESRVDESDIGRVQVRTEAAVRFNAFAGRTFRGRVARILPDADRERKSFEVDIDLVDAVPGLRPGMTAEVNIILKEDSAALLVPVHAVHDHHAWVARDGRLSRREVEVGIRDLTRVEVLRGLSEGEQVVLDDEDRLRDGLPVRVQDR